MNGTPTFLIFPVGSKNFAQKNLREHNSVVNFRVVTAPIQINFMFLSLNHRRLHVYTASLEFVVECYRLTAKLPIEEKFGMIAQIRRAAISVHLNIAEGCSRKSEAERKRFYEIARGSLIEIDAALDVAHELSYLKNNMADILGEKMIRCFKLLTGLIR